MASLPDFGSGDLRSTRGRSTYFGSGNMKHEPVPGQLIFLGDIMPCLNESIVGGFSTCSAGIKSMNMCPCHCKYYIKDKIEESWEFKEYTYEYENCKTRWNESRHRCYEGIHVDKKIPKIHKDEWDWKQYWEKKNIEFMIKWFGPIWCKEHGLI